MSSNLLFMRAPVNVFPNFHGFLRFGILLLTFCFIAGGAAAQNSAENAKRSEKREKLIKAAQKAVQNLGECPAQPISFGQTINGSLAAGDCMDDQTGQLADVYIFSAAQQTLMSSAFASAQFDTFLMLFDLTGNLIAFNDNQDGTTTNSRIPPSGNLTLPSTNQYLLFATSLNPAARGNYTINLLGGANCTFTLNPTSQNFPAAGGTGSFTVTASSQTCSWQAQSNTSWVTTTSSGTGNGTVNYTVGQNTSQQGRGAFISIGQQTFSVQQSALICNYSFSPSPLEVSWKGGAFSFTVNAASPLCPTNIVPGIPWISYQNPTGSGTRTINAVIQPNNAYPPRFITITIAGAGVQTDLKQRGRTPDFDFDNDNRANIALYRPNSGLWAIKNVNIFTGEPLPNDTYFSFGQAADKPVPADYDEDGIPDFAVYRDGNWFIMQSRNSTFRAYSFGLGSDLPRPGDFDGDNKADFCVYRPATGDWFRINSSDGTFYGIRFGTSEDKPLLTDFNGDGRNEIAVYRPSIGAWFWLDNANGAFNAVNFGISTDIPVPADFDGDGKTDITVFRPSNGAWYRLNSSNVQFFAFTFGAPGDIPAPADYDGDSKADHTVFRPANGTWYRIRSGSNFFDAWAFGTVGDIPLPAAYQ